MAFNDLRRANAQSIQDNEERSRNYQIDQMNPHSKRVRNDTKNISALLQNKLKKKLQDELDFDKMMCDS